MPKVQPDELRAVERYLEEEGYSIVARDYQVKKEWGRLDYVARSGPFLPSLRSSGGIMAERELARLNAMPW